MRLNSRTKMFNANALKFLGEFKRKFLVHHAVFETFWCFLIRFTKC